MRQDRGCVESFRDPYVMINDIKNAETTVEHYAGQKEEVSNQAGWMVSTITTRRKIDVR